MERVNSPGFSSTVSVGMMTEYFPGDNHVVPEHRNIETEIKSHGGMKQL